MRLRNNPKAMDIIKENPDFVINDPSSYKGIWKDVFLNHQPIYVEIGMGKGDFIYQNALKYPDINFIGIEKFPSVLASAINKIKKQGVLPNLRLFYYDAIALNDVFSKNEIDHIFLNFSDPWPKSRHEKRRLTSPKFLDVYKLIIKRDGFIEFKTDNRGLFEYSILSMNQYPMNFDFISLDLHQNQEANENIMSEYERKFCDKGPIYKLKARFIYE